MWLLPAFSVVSRVVTGVFYRVSTAGGNRVPRDGPVLLVANHPNSLLDPMLVVSAARRPVRFLAKAPLFVDPLIGWAIRASGAIPVHRQVDDPSRTGENVNMFRAVHAALADGAAVGLFPEGISHSHPSLTPLKTGAARMALGTAAVAGVACPIVPVGVVLVDKTRFRSEVHVVVGEPVEWTDLAARGEDDRDAVRTLTDRIDEALRAVTVNLDEWSDGPLVECAERIWVAEFGPEDHPAARVARTGTVTAVLRSSRERPHSEIDKLIADLIHHRQQLHRLGLAPRDLRADVSMAASVRWAMQRFFLVALPATVIGLLGKLVFVVPYHVTARIPRLTRPDPDQVSTHKILYGMALHVVWLVALVIVAWRLGGWIAGLGTAIGAPLAALVAIWTTDRWIGKERDIRRFFKLRSRRTDVAALRDRQHDLATRLQQLHRRWQVDTSFTNHYP